MHVYTLVSSHAQLENYLTVIGYYHFLLSIHYGPPNRDFFRCLPLPSTVYQLYTHEHVISESDVHMDMYTLYVHVYGHTYYIHVDGYIDDLHWTCMYLTLHTLHLHLHLQCITPLPTPTPSHAVIADNVQRTKD